MAKRKKPTPAQRKKRAKRAKERREKHTKFLTDNQILHFARSHQSQRPKPCAAEGKCNDYAANTEGGTPPATMNQSYEAAAHHILPVSAVAGFVKYIKDDDGRKNVASVYAKMEWCINKKANLMWLPYFPAYQRHLSAGNPGGAPSGLAAHNFDHNPHYNNLVTDILQPHWDGMAAKQPAPDCKKHEEMVQTLESLISQRKPKLQGRSTQAILDKVQSLRQEGKSPKDIQRLVEGAKSGDVLSQWWKAFSMAPGSAQKRPAAMLTSRPPPRKVRQAIKSRTEAGT